VSNKIGRVEAQETTVREQPSPWVLPSDDAPERRTDAIRAFSTSRGALPRAEGRRADVRLMGQELPRYEPIRSLGVGGMGEVMLVLDRDIGRLVAVKRLFADFDEVAGLRFAHEVRMLGRIDHPNVVPIYDVSVDHDGRHFFVMKYVEGETLSSIIRRLREGDPAYHRDYPVERRIAIFLDVLKALAAAHAKGVLHLDLKPANVMVGQKGEVVVMDWGIAKSVVYVDQDAPNRPANEGTHPQPYPTGAVVGTPRYMSPEQALGKDDRLDERSDLYSATALFHELLALEHYLGEKDSSSKVLEAIVADELPLHRLVQMRHPAQKSVPLELLRFVAKGLEKDPSRRFQSAWEMIHVLEEVLDARGTLERTVAAARRRLRGFGLLIVAYLHLAWVSALLSRQSA
jgi:serine/threonine-protein kinase